jgi:hypothetical protein
LALLLLVMPWRLIMFARQDWPQKDQEPAFLRARITFQALWGLFDLCGIVSGVLVFVTAWRARALLHKLRFYKKSWQKLCVSELGWLLQDLLALLQIGVIAILIVRLPSFLQRSWKLWKRHQAVERGVQAWETANVQPFENIIGPDVTGLILSHLNPTDLSRVAQVSKRFQSISDRDILWAKFLDPSVYGRKPDGTYPSSADLMRTLKHSSLKQFYISQFGKRWPRLWLRVDDWEAGFRFVVNQEFLWALRDIPQTLLIPLRILGVFFYFCCLVPAVWVVQTLGRKNQDSDLPMNFVDSVIPKRMGKVAGIWNDALWVVLLAPFLSLALLAEVVISLVFYAGFAVIALQVVPRPASLRRLLQTLLLPITTLFFLFLALLPQFLLGHLVVYRMGGSLTAYAWHVFWALFSFRGVFLGFLWMFVLFFAFQTCSHPLYWAWFSKYEPFSVPRQCSLIAWRNLILPAFQLLKSSCVFVLNVVKQFLVFVISKILSIVLSVLRLNRVVLARTTSLCYRHRTALWAQSLLIFVSLGWICFPLALPPVLWRLNLVRGYVVLIPATLVTLFRLRQSVGIISKNYGEKRKTPQTLKVESVYIELGAPGDLLQNGIRILLQGGKPASFVAENISLSVEGEQFWRDFSHIAGAHIVALVRWSGLYPLVLAPFCQLSTAFVKNQDTFDLKLTLATDQHRYKAKGETFMKLIRGLEGKSQALLELVFDFGTSGWTGFAVKGCCCRITFTPKQLLAAVAEKGSGFLEFGQEGTFVD